MTTPDTIGDMPAALRREKPAAAPVLPALDNPPVPTALPAETATETAVAAAKQIAAERKAKGKTKQAKPAAEPKQAKAKQAKPAAEPKQAKPKTTKAKAEPAADAAPRVHRSIVPARFKERYALHDDTNGDRVAEALKRATTTTNEDGRECLDVAALRVIAAANGIDMAKYEALNNGQKRMNVGNRLRGLLKNGQKVVVGKQTFANAEKALARPETEPMPAKVAAPAPAPAPAAA